MSLKLITTDRRFWPLFWTQFFGALNDNYFKNALVILIAYKNIEIMGQGAAALVAMAGGIFILPFFLFSATSGQLADRFSKTTIVRMAKVAELLIMILGGAGLFFESYSFLLAVLFLMGTQSTFFGPAKYGIIPQLIKKEELMPGNAFIGAGTFIAILIGTLIGGLSAASEDSVILTTSGIVLISVVGIITSFFLKKVEPQIADLEIDWTFARSTVDILKKTYEDRRIFAAVIGMSWFWFIGASVLSLIPNLCKDVFKSSEEVGTLFLTSFTIGMAVGAFLSDKISKHKPELGMVPIATIFMSLCMFDLAYVSYNFSADAAELLTVSQFFEQDYSIRALFDLFFISIFGGLYVIPQQTFIQDYAPAKILSRIIAGNNIWNSFFMVTAAVFIMVLGAIGVSLAGNIVAIAILTLISSFILYAVHSFDALRVWGQVLSHLFYKLEVKGKENVPLDGAVVIVANHVSFIDWLLIYAASPRSVRFVIDHAYYFRPGLKFWFDQAGLIPIATRKESEDVLEKAFSSMANAIDSGHCLGLFPEGWLTRDGKMRKFQPGVSKIVRDHKTPVIPMAINGLWGSFFSFSGKGALKGLPSFKRRKVTVTIMEAIHPEEFSLKELEELIHEKVNYETDKNEGKA